MSNTANTPDYLDRCVETVTRQTGSFNRGVASGVRSACAKPVVEGTNYCKFHTTIRHRRGLEAHRKFHATARYRIRRDEGRDADPMEVEAACGPCRDRATRNTRKEI